MRKTVLISSLCLLGISAKTQAPPTIGGTVPNVDFSVYFPERNSIASIPSAIDANSNAFITGYTTPLASGNRDATTFKINAQGALMWTNYYNNGGNDNAKAIMLDQNGDVIIVGESMGATSGNDIFVSKINGTTGVTIWTKRYTSNGSNNDVANALTIDPTNGDIFVTGYITNTNGNKDYVFLKYNAAGTQQFVNTFGSTTLDDEATGIAINGNRLYITGTSNNNNQVSATITTLKINPNNGNIQWTKVESGSTPNGYNVASAILTYNNDVIIVGQVDNINTGKDYISTYYNGNNGTVAWRKTYDNGNTQDYATALVRDASGKIVVTGVSNNGSTFEYHTLMYNASGAQQWVNKTKTNLVSPNVAPQIACDALANHFYVSGEKLGTQADVYVYQITPGGNRTWEQTFNGAQNSTDAAVDLVASANGVIYVAAMSLNSNAKFDYNTIRISQTPVYFPIDISNQSASNSHLYLKNEGQLRKTDTTFASEVLYHTPNSNPEVYIEKNAFNFVFAKKDTSVNGLDTLERIQCNFTNSNPLARYYNFVPKGHTYNYFLGDAVSQEITDLKASERVFVPNFYPNIDLHYFSNKDGIKYYFVVKPNTKVEGLNLNILGASNTFTTSNNSLFIDGYLGDIELNQPIAYQVNILMQIVPLGATTWKNNGANTFGVNLPTYNANLPLVIMVTKKATIPQAGGASGNLDYSTYYGNINNDVFNDIKVATNGDRYIIGNTDGGNFPKVNSTSTYKGFSDAVFLKYSNIKDSLVFASFYGAPANEFGNSIDINSTGEIYIGGQTFSQSLPVLFVSGASNQTQNGTVGNSNLGFLGDGFLARFSPNGNALLWARYYGGSRDDKINSIHIDNANNLHYTGSAYSTDIPMINAAQPNVATWQTSNNADAIIGKFNSNNSIVYTTYFGGTSSLLSNTQDVGMDITTDGSGNAIVVGWTNCNDLPTNNSTGNPNTFFKAGIGVTGQDGFIARYSLTGAKQFASYFGSNGANAVDEITRVNYNVTKNEIYFAGNSNDTTNFPYVNLQGAFNQKTKATRAAFIASMSGNLTKQWCTNYGTTAGTNFNVTGLTSDNAGIIYLTGQAKSSTLNFPINSPTLTVFQNAIRNADDGFVAVFDPNKDLFHAHYLGGTGNDYINNAHVGTNKELYMVGQTGSTNFPVAYDNTNINFIDSTFGGGIGQYDGFITRFDMNTISIISVKENKLNENIMNVFPNPAVNGFMIDLKDVDIKNSNLVIYNIAGQIIADVKITQNQTQIACESWANGVYLIKVNLNGTSQTFKLIKN